MSELMEDPRHDPRMENMAENPHVVAMDMALRGLFAPHLCCDHGLGGSLLTAVTMNVLGAVASQCGLAKEDIYAEGFWDQLKMNFAAGYHAYVDNRVAATHKGSGLVK